MCQQKEWISAETLHMIGEKRKKRLISYKGNRSKSLTRIHRDQQKGKEKHQGQEKLH